VRMSHVSEGDSASSAMFLSKLDLKLNTAVVESSFAQKSIKTVGLDRVDLIGSLLYLRYLSVSVMCLTDSCM
jgi:hypothetical protein